jgi:RNA polymerase sigma-70 factor (ECF subfamily)
MTGPLSIALDETPSDVVPDRLAALFDAHEDRLYRLARRLTPSADEANDLVQETFLRAAKSLRSIPVGANREEAWLVRVLINVRRDEWRRSSVRTKSLARFAARDSASPTAESSLIAKQIVWAALDALHPRRRAIVIMHELDGLSIPSIASLVGVHAVTVRWHLSMARRELRRLLGADMGDTR